MPVPSGARRPCDPAARRAGAVPPSRSVELVKLVRCNEPRSDRFIHVRTYLATDDFAFEDGHHVLCLVAVRVANYEGRCAEDAQDSFRRDD